MRKLIEINKRTICLDVDANTTKEEEDAMKLFSAAPEMLDALQRLLNKVYCNEISLPLVVCEEINSIIKKATE